MSIATDVWRFALIGDDGAIVRTIDLSLDEVLRTGIVFGDGPTGTALFVEVARVSDWHIPGARKRIDLRGHVVLSDAEELRRYRMNDEIGRRQRAELNAQPCGKCDKPFQPANWDDKSTWNNAVRYEVRYLCQGPCGCTGRCRAVRYCYECSKAAIEVLGHDPMASSLRAQGYVRGEDGLHRKVR